MRPSHTFRCLSLFGCVTAILALAAPSLGAAHGIEVPGLLEAVSATTDGQGVVHVVAANDLDLARIEGWLHARDRLFQMDLTRREASGDLAELLGPLVLGSDIENRTVGLRRAAERSLAVLSDAERDVLQAYADGVNAYLAENSLPPEYAELEISAVRPWSAIDTLTIVKAIAASLSLDIDIGPTLAFQGFVAAGSAGGFDGATLFLEDVNRSAPIDPASTVPDATGTFPFLAKAALKPDAVFLAKAAAAARPLTEKLERSPLLARTMNRHELQIGSNEWGVAAEYSESGLPMIANDPHLALNAPSTFYEWHLVVRADPGNGPMNVSGVGFPGAPGVILGQNEHITWGATTNSLDVSDIFQDELHAWTDECVALGASACIRSEGELHPVEIEFATYWFNVLGDGELDNLKQAELSLEERTIATVPFRSFGPVLNIADPGVLTPPGGVTTVLVLQYTGFHATREIGTFLTWNRARNLADFRAGLADFDVGSQNWAYADVDGNIAYFTSAELPLRRDLEAGMVHDGIPPAFIRDGSGPANWVPDPARQQGQAIPFETLPFEEMPQTVNPSRGFFVNANNDPAGTTLDNNPLNQVRPSKPTAIYYLAPGYANGLRAGRITRLVRDQIAAEGQIGLADMKRFQANTQQLDAELLVPFVLAAFENASRPGAPAELAQLAADPEIAEAVDRLADWDFSTPTGIPEGYDANDRMGKRSSGVSKSEARASVAATLYNLWRSMAVRGVIDARLAELETPGVGSSEALKALHVLLSEEPFDGVGASGVDFFPPDSPGSPLGAEERRDQALLSALRRGLDRLASDEFAPAFGNSTSQDDYRWGLLHRIVFDHPTNPLYSIPPAASFEDVAPGLPGLARDGGYEVVNASGFSARAAGLNSFRFGSGPVRRYVGEASTGGGSGAKVRGSNVVPGGPSGVPGDPLYATQLGTWLTADYHKVVMKSDGAGGMNLRSEHFVPTP